MATGRHTLLSCVMARGRRRPHGRTATTPSPGMLLAAMSVLHINIPNVRCGGSAVYSHLYRKKCHTAVGRSGRGARFPGGHALIKPFSEGIRSRQRIQDGRAPQPPHGIGFKPLKDPGNHGNPLHVP